CVDVLERDEARAVEPARLVPAVLGEPAVVGIEARALELAVGHPEERHAEARGEQLGGDAGELLVGDAREGVPAARPRLLVALAEDLLQRLARAPGGEAARDREGRRALGDEEPARARTGVLDDARRAVAVAPVEALPPEVRGLRHVGVRRDDAVPHGPPSSTRPHPTPNRPRLQA